MEKKKIGIITIHTDFNYGAVLQAVATQKFFEINGYDSEIIDYENKVISQQSKICYKQGGKIKGYFISFVRNTLFGRYHYYKKAVENLDLYRKKSKEKYNSLEELEMSPYDILVAGSDQIWNPLISGELDPVFLLDFGKEKKKISVATSMGSYTLSDSERRKFNYTLEDFEFISVRENHAKRQLQPLVKKDIKVLLDPTLLLDKNAWWNNLGKNSKYSLKKERYIVTYFVGGNKNKYRQKIKEYADKLQLPVWTIQYSNYYWKESNKKILGASIADFIALIKNADLVLTDSFHGVAFSVNLGIDFVALTNTENPIRVKEFLTKIELEERIDMSSDTYTSIDYEDVSRKIELMRKDSAEWLLNAIQ